eukprot:2644672-Pleurochrysis_carterae.AAC.5
MACWTSNDGTRGDLMLATAWTSVSHAFTLTSLYSFAHAKFRCCSSPHAVRAMPCANDYATRMQY